MQSIFDHKSWPRRRRRALSFGLPSGAVSCDLCAFPCVPNRSSRSQQPPEFHVRAIPGQNPKDSRLADACVIQCKEHRLAPWPARCVNSIRRARSWQRIKFDRAVAALTEVLTTACLPRFAAGGLAVISHRARFLLAADEVSQALVWDATRVDAPSGIPYNPVVFATLVVTNVA